MTFIGIVRTLWLVVPPLDQAPTSFTVTAGKLWRTVTSVWVTRMIFLTDSSVQTFRIPPAHQLYNISIDMSIKYSSHIRSTSCDVFYSLYLLW